jgi:F-type H+-transporting ATPase subunit a
MTAESITPDQVIILQWGPVSLNSTICYTWGVMALLTLGSWLITRHLSSGPRLSRWQNLLEIIVAFVQDQIHEISHKEPKRYLPFIGTLFLFIAVSNVLDVAPGFHAPTASLSTTAALAVCVLFAVPMYGIAEEGFWNYLKHYVKPSVFMLPFNILGELSRTLALAVRLFGNIMSGAKLAAILLAVAPFFLPVLMNALGLLTGLIQAYIFAILTMVYIASAGHGTNEAPTGGVQEALEKGGTHNG